MQKRTLTQFLHLYCFVHPIIAEINYIKPLPVLKNIFEISLETCKLIKDII